MSGPYVVQIDLNLTEKLRQGLESQGFVLAQPAYTLFQAKKPGVSCTLYTSGKLVIQGKEMAEFIEYYLEPEILQNFNYRYQAALITVDYEPHMGSDESGKGDYFGPLCIATLYASKEGIAELIQLGVKDSKKLTDKTILPLAKKLAAKFDHHIIKIGPPKYNELITKFGNLNVLLAWAHATAIDALAKRTGCSKVLVDKFAHESILQKALKQKKQLCELTQRTKAEEDPVVAAASILARASFVEELARLSTVAHMTLPKGASNLCIEVGKKIVKEHGKEVLSKVAKIHFKTTQAILD